MSETTQTTIGQYENDSDLVTDGGEPVDDGDDQLLEREVECRECGKETTRLVHRVYSVGEATTLDCGRCGETTTFDVVGDAESDDDSDEDPDAGGESSGHAKRVAEQLAMAEDSELVPDGGREVATLELLEERLERLHPNVSPGATLVVDGFARDVEVRWVQAVEESRREQLRELAESEGLERWAEYEVVGEARTGRVGETASGEVYELKLRDGELELEEAELLVVATDGGEK